MRERRYSLSRLACDPGYSLLPGAAYEVSMFHMHAWPSTLTVPSSILRSTRSATRTYYQGVSG